MSVSRPARLTFGTMATNLLAVLLVVGVAQSADISSASNNFTGYIPSSLGADLLQRAEAALVAEVIARDATQFRHVTCPPPVRAASCPPSKYRSIDGTCNNVRHPQWGARGSQLLRLLPPHYQDEISSPREPPPTSYQVVDGLRKVRPQGQSHKHVTSMLGVWGEMVLEDLANTLNPVTIPCCTSSHQECYLEDENGKCHSYIRSVPSINENCQFDHREQMNLATGFLDGSSLYGSVIHDVEKLKTSEEGKIKIESCSKCGEASGRGALHALLVQEHNRVASQLGDLNKHWSNEMLFEEARRIVIAEIQHITYNEFLPTILGEVLTDIGELKLKEDGTYNNYSSNNHAGVYNAAAVAALQVFLAMIPPTLASSHSNVTIHTDSVQADLIHMLLETPAQEPSLLAPMPGNDGIDMGSLLIHKGRDHGIPAYGYWLNHCLERSVNISDLNQYMEGSSADLLRKLYGKLENVDLLAGGLLETPVHGAVVGPTFACILAQQFMITRNSDRFWYENDIPPSSFTEAQLPEIRKVTLSGMMCANTPELFSVQPKAFVQEDPYLNIRINCELQSTLDLSPWKESDANAQISEDLLALAVEKAEASMIRRRQIEYQLWSQRGSADPKSAVGTIAAFNKANKQALERANISHLLEYTSHELINSLRGSNDRVKRQVFDGLNFPDDFPDNLQNVDITPFLPPPGPMPTDCDSPEDRGPCDARSPFRSITGRCNNLRWPKMGKVLTTFARLLPPAYMDGIAHPRLGSVTGVPLPSPRSISTTVHPDVSHLSGRYSLMLMQFAQFLDHDLTMTPVHRGFFTSIPDCRPCDSAHTVHPECMPIPIPTDDHFYPPINQTTGERMCFPFMRSLPGQLNLGHRDQINQNSAYLDASQIYGENSCQARDLRSFRGRLNVTHHPARGKDLLPQSPVHPECKAPSGYCFIAGDGRASEQPALTALHTIFMREHNRVADGLYTLNPHWDDELLYQHSRRIISATLQHITYNEFLPRILGWNAVNLYELKLRPHGYYSGYSPKCNPSILNEFATAAFRIGHSLLRPHIPRMNALYQAVDPPILLRHGFFNPDMIYQVHIIDEIVRGLVSTPMENLDQFITGEISNHLFEDRRIPHSGVDLISLNIQRGRDHGLRPYNDYRALCNLKRATTFEDLSREMSPEVIARLKHLYATVDDIDLFPGGLSERPVQGGLVGPTFACIIGIQFRQLRKCDRFWYENEDPVVRFTEAQLAEIRKATLARILCENMDGPHEMQRSAFDLPNNFLNPRIPCLSLQHMDLGPWRETQHGCNINGRTIPIGESMFPSPCTSCICTPDGPQCASLRIKDCGQLMREASRDAIFNDDVCTAQCGFLLSGDDFPIRGKSLPALSLIPPPRRRRPHFKISSLNGFVG